MKVRKANMNTLVEYDMVGGTPQCLVFIGSRERLSDVIGLA